MRIACEHRLFDVVVADEIGKSVGTQEKLVTLANRKRLAPNRDLNLGLTSQSADNHVFVLMVARLFERDYSHVDHLHNGRMIFRHYVDIAATYQVESTVSNISAMGRTVLNYQGGTSCPHAFQGFVSLGGFVDLVIGCVNGASQ